MVTITDFPWGLMVEVLENFTFFQLILFRENADPLALPRLLASSLEKSDVINVKHLILLVEKLPTMFENPKFLKTKCTRSKYGLKMASTWSRCIKYKSDHRISSHFS